jgi:hypothetical protein
MRSRVRTVWILWQHNATPGIDFAAEIPTRPSLGSKGATKEIKKFYATT